MIRGVTTQQGFALIAVSVLLSFTILVSLAMAGVYLSNTRATQLDQQSLKADFLFTAAVRVAALSIASPRSRVSSQASTQTQFTYAAGATEINVIVHNEAGFVDLNKAAPELLDSLLQASASTGANIETLQDELLRARELNQSPITMREVYNLLSRDDLGFGFFLQRATTHSLLTGVNPALAPREVLDVVPNLSEADIDSVLASREDTQSNRGFMLSSGTESDYFTERFSSYYRVTAQFTLENQVYTRTMLIKMLNHPSRLYDLIEYW